MTTLASVRRMLGAILLLGTGGTMVELLLVGHDEGAIQLVPLVLLGIGFLTVCWRMASGSSASAAAVQIVMVLFLAAGGTVP